MTRAILIDKTDDGQSASLTDVTLPALEDGQVAVEVAYSTLNYKDALALTGAAPVVRSFPMVPGIDLSGIVRESRAPSLQPGDRVVLNGWGVGEKHWGGLGERAHLNADWLVKLPDGISLKQAMAIGTAGYTAMLCVMALEAHGLTPASGEVVVTGASGGVGSVAVALLAARGYRGGGDRAAGRGRVSDRAGRDLGPGPGGTDRHAARPGQGTLGGRGRCGGRRGAGQCPVDDGLSRRRGGLRSGGRARPADHRHPFILRGVTLAGVDSVMCPRPDRLTAWQRLANELDMSKLEAMVTEVPLAKVPAVAPRFLDGQVRGRIVVPVNPALG